MRKNKLLIALLAVGAMIGLASCQKESFTITFNTNDGSKIESITVLEDGTIAAPTNPTKEGYVFKGWYLDADFNNPIDFASYIVEGNVTLYAKWEASTYTVTFNTNGGTGTAAPVTVNHGEKITLPTGLTKDGCKLKAWYKDAALTIPFVPSAPVTSDLTLYAKWESLLTFSGTNSGNATYNAKDGTYTFTTTLGLYGRFSVAYNGALLSSDPEGDLIITGAFTSENQAGWDENLYCDVPDGAEAGSPIDYTTFICSSSRSVNYTVTYDPAANSLDIQAEFVPDEYEIPEEGLFYLVRDNNRLLSSYDAVEVNEDGSYSFTLELSRWWRVYLYFDGVEIDVTGQAADIKGDFGTWSGRDNPKSLYFDLDNDGPNAFISSYDGTVEHKITYVPATDSAKAYVIIDADYATDPYDPSQEGVVQTSFSVDNAQDSALAVWTTAGTVFRDSAAGSWGPLGNGWRTVCIIDAEGKIVYFTVNMGNGYGSVSDGEVKYYAHPDYAANNPAYSSTDAGWKVTLPEGCVAITGHSEKSLAFLLALTGSKFASSDDAQVVVNNMHAINEDARIVYDATASTVEVVDGGAGEQPAPDQPKELTPAQTNADAGADAFALWTTAGHTFHTPSGWNNGGWRLFVVVDAEGRIAYMVVNAPNGYGGPSGDGYYANGYYTDYTTNPSLQILEGYGPWVKDDPNKASEQFNIVIPEGGFGISAHGEAIKALLVSFANDANVAVGDAAVNKRGILDDDLRLKIVNGKLIISDAAAEDKEEVQPEANPNVPEQGLGFSYSSGAQGTDIIYCEDEDIIDNGDGTYTFVVELAAWRYVNLYWNGYLLDTASTLVLESKGNIYIGDAPDPSDRLYTNSAGKFEFVFTPATDSAKAKVVAGPYVPPVEEKETYTWTASDYEYAVVYSEAGTIVDTVSKYRIYIVVDAKGRIAYMVEPQCGAYGNPYENSYIRHSAYADYKTNPAFTELSDPKEVSGEGWSATIVDYKVVVPQGGFIIEAWNGNQATSIVKMITGKDYVEAGWNTNTINVDNVRLENNNGVITISFVEEVKWTASDYEYAVIYSEAGTIVDTVSKYRIYIVVDAKGRIAYMVEPQCGAYGNPYENSYIRHSAYADYKTNPAFTELSDPKEVSGEGWSATIVDYKVVVPQGGFIIEAWNGNQATSIVKMITGKDYVEAGWNTNTINVDNVRLENNNGVITITFVEEEEEADVCPATFGEFRKYADASRETGNMEYSITEAGVATFNYPAAPTGKGRVITDITGHDVSEYGYLKISHECEKEFSLYLWLNSTSGDRAYEGDVKAEDGAIYIALTDNVTSMCFNLDRYFNAATYTAESPSKTIVLTFEFVKEAPAE